jgi:hypothetical protein
VRRRLLVAVVAAVVLQVAGAARADVPRDPSAPGPTLQALCLTAGLGAVPVVGADGCKTVDSGAIIAAEICTLLSVDPATCAQLTDGRTVDPADVDAFERGWVHRALQLQARLDDDQPLRDALIPHTHNSFNAPQYGPSVTTLDPNQRVTMTDQMRMGIRALEIDLHWVLSPEALLHGGSPQGVTVCHGQTTDVGGVPVHVGCSLDRPLGPALAEVRRFLEARGNEREVILLYLQNELDGSRSAHASAVRTIERELGPLVARPSGAAAGTCQDLPVERSRAELRAAGGRVVLVGNCGPGAWSSWVFQRGDGWDERANTAGYPDLPGCEQDRVARGYDEHLIRVTEDSTWLSAVSATPAPITPREVRSMVRCGVELIGLDRIGPADPRLAELVWSWAPNEPSTAGACALWRTDARFRAAGCGEVHRVACRLPSRGWVVPDRSGAWGDGSSICAAVGATFDVPRSGWDDEQLRRVAGAGADGELWLALADAGAAGWMPQQSSP